jgi:hypothetical protein
MPAAAPRAFQADQPALRSVPPFDALSPSNNVSSRFRQTTLAEMRLINLRAEGRTRVIIVPTIVP